MAVAIFVAVVALGVGITMLVDHRTGRAVIFIAAGVVAALLAVLARPR